MPNARSLLRLRCTSGEAILSNSHPGMVKLAEVDPGPNAQRGLSIYTYVVACACIYTCKCIDIYNIYLYIYICKLSAYAYASLNVSLCAHSCLYFRPFMCF